MTMKKFITMDLETGKKVLQTIEASFIKFSDEQHFPGATNVEQALKVELTRALEAERVLTSNLDKEIKRAEGVEAAIKALIGELGEQDSSVKAAIDRIDNLISDLTLNVTEHVEDEEIHITAEEREAWDQAVQDLTTKADRDTVTAELGRKVATDYLMDSKGKIKTDRLPSIAVNDVHTVTDETKAMELVIENGDIVIINPDVKEAKSKNKVIKGTFICVDITKDLFEERFRQLYSNADSISKAEVTELINAETDRAGKVEEGLRSDILTINGGDDVAGSIRHAVKIERDRAKFEEWKLDQRLSAIEPTVEQLAGGEEVEGSAANLAKEALTEANKYTDAEITKVKSDATTLTERVGNLEEVVGDVEDGLVKDVDDLQDAVDVIKGSGVGSINKALADANAHTDEKVAEELAARTAADTALSNRIDSLEASENLSITLGCVGIEQHELLAIRADNTVVKATLTDSSVVGIVARAKGPNSKTVISGRVSGFQGLKPGSNYFLGENGQITDKMPTEVGQYIIKVGVALTATDLLVNVQEAIRIGD